MYCTKGVCQQENGKNVGFVQVGAKSLDFIR